GRLGGCLVEFIVDVVRRNPGDCAGAASSEAGRDGGRRSRRSRGNDSGGGHAPHHDNGRSGTGDGHFGKRTSSGGNARTGRAAGYANTAAGTSCDGTARAGSPGQLASGPTCRAHSIRARSRTTAAN